MSPAQSEAAAKQAQIDMAFKPHDPKRDANLNPFINKKINPDSNLSINPSIELEYESPEGKFSEPDTKRIDQPDDQPAVESAVE